MRKYTWAIYVVAYLYSKHSKINWLQVFGFLSGFFFIMILKK